MKVTYSWLKDFVNFKANPQELADRLTMAGLEVVSIEKTGDDFVLEIEITSNRPDWLSVVGIAREIGAIYAEKLKTIRYKEPKIKIKDTLPFKISVADKKDCCFYSARIIRGLKVGPSPEWLKKRLESLGCRSVNNVVDVTNYYLFESGQPLHAFDLDKLEKNQIQVRRAGADEKITTLDGQTRLLNPEILVIADARKPVAIAGIMGGVDSEVTSATGNILLESAVFSPVLVRRAKQRLGLGSEAAYRFERGVDPEQAKQVSLAAQELIIKLASGLPAGYKSLGTPKPTQPAINLHIRYLNKLLGTVIPLTKVKQILSRLGLHVQSRGANCLSVKVPSFRQDLKLPVDLVEEVARIYGYDKIPQTLPKVLPARQTGGREVFASGIKNILSSLGLEEAITYSLVDEELLSQAGVNPEISLVRILNPLSKEQELLRPELFPSLIRAVAHNLNQQQEQIGIFEIANVYYGQKNLVIEEPILGIALCGSQAFFTGQGLSREQITLLHLKGILETLFNRLGIKDFDFIPQDADRINITVGGRPGGFMLSPNPQVLAAFEIKNRQVFLSQINLNRLFGEKIAPKKFLGIPKYPAITRDISFLVKEDIPVNELLKQISAAGQPLLEQAKILDYYQGKQIPAGFRGLTISCIYRLSSRTLTEEEVTPVHNTVCSLLQKDFGIKLR